MTPIKAKAEAEKIRQSFFDLIGNDAIAKSCSIRHVKGQIEENYEIDKDADISVELTRLLIKRMNHWQSILTCLEEL